MFVIIVRDGLDQSWIYSCNNKSGQGPNIRDRCHFNPDDSSVLYGLPLRDIYRESVNGVSG